MGSRFGKFIGMLLVLGLVFMAGGFLIYLFDEVAPKGFEQLLMGLVALGGMAWIVLRGPIGKAIGGMLEGRALPEDGLLASRVADLEDRVQEISLETQRFMEIEERLDFTERLLAAQPDADRRDQS